MKVTFRWSPEGTKEATMLRAEEHTRRSQKKKGPKQGGRRPVQQVQSREGVEGCEKIKVQGLISMVYFCFYSEWIRAIEAFEQKGPIIQFVPLLAAALELSFMWAKVNTERPVRFLIIKRSRSVGTWWQQCRWGDLGKYWLYLEVTEFAAALGLRC